MRRKTDDALSIGGQIVGLRGERTIGTREEQVVGDEAVECGNVGAELRGAELGFEGGDVGSVMAEG